MKIGIITFHHAPNQGAVLQAYALQTLLESWGHHVEFIDYRRLHAFNCRDFISKSPKLLLEKWQNQVCGFIYRNFRKDFNKVLHINNRRYYSVEELRANPPVFDLYITGSDQVWNFLQKIDGPYVLDFVPADKPKIAYAASMGQCNIPKHLHAELRNLLSSFQAISVREKNGKDFIDELMTGYEIDIRQTLDPTLLIAQKSYEGIAEPTHFKQPYLVSYILSMLEKGHEEVLKYVQGKFKMPILNMRNPDTCVRLPFAKNEIVTPYQFLSYIKHSSLVVCSSFHAVVFSLIFHKPFIVLIPSMLKSKGGNQRINSLLAPLGLSRRCVYGFEFHVIDELLNEVIDWDFIDAEIKRTAQDSIKFLQDSIHD